MYKHTETRSRNDYCRGKAKSITYSECVSIALVIQRAKRKFRIILPTVVYLARPYFPTLSPNRHDFREKVTEYKMCVQIFSTTFVWAGDLSRYSHWLRAGRSGDRMPVGTRFSAPVQTGPGAHPASCTTGTGYFQGVNSGRGVTLTPHPF